jgi:ATP-dependent exoDNAse (exonuclease V) beta subunit
MIADDAARQRALDVSTSFIVQAPAGSGKTELLIQRYLRLLEGVDSPGAVVAITFTRKAAGEMRARVVDSLRSADAGVAPASAHHRVTFEIARRVLETDRRKGWSLLRNPAQLSIHTIDALCASITRRMPWLARFGAMPDISEKALDLYREAAQNTLRHVEEDNQPIANLLLHLDNDYYVAEKLIVQMLERRDQWLRHTGVQPDFAAVRRELETSLQRVILRHLQELRDAFEPDLAAEISLLRDLDRFPSACLDDLECWHSIAGLLLTQAGKWRKRAETGLGPSLKRRCEPLLARLQSNQMLLDALKTFRELPAPRFSDSQWQALEAAVSVLALAVAELRLVFREKRRVDYPELAIRASEALGDPESPTDLALALGYRIQHILVDEFQDTSFTQVQLLEKLTAGWEPGDGRTLFLVGDPMQSIYRFRQADVGLFLKARLDGIGAIRLEPLTLSVNFRSQPEIVAWVNDAFDSIFPKQDDVDAGAVSYSPSIAGTARESGQVKVHAVRDAREGAERALDLLRTGPRGRCAILVRARAHLVSIVPLLRREGIRFQAVEIDELGQRPVVEDLLALTRALLHAADRVSWLAILRAPWCGLTLYDLHALAHENPDSTIWDLLHRPNSPVSDDGAARIRRILPMLERAHAERGRQSLRDWVEGVWLRLGGPACVDDTAIEDAAAYLDLLEGLEQGADLDDFEWFREQVNELFAQPDAEAGDDLQLMTIHKAKGLEFDTVILPALDSTSGQDKPQLLLWLELPGEMLMAPVAESGGDKDQIYDYLARLEKRKTEQETARLLYVAATRARSNLHLIGSVSRKDGSIAEPQSGSFLKLLWSRVSVHFIDAARAAPPEIAAPIRTLRRVPADWSLPAPPLPAPRASRMVEVASAQEIEWAGATRRHAGTALHGFLQRIAREGLESWDEHKVRSQRDVFQAVLANLGVPPGELREAAARVEAGLLGTLKDPRGRWILEAHREAECETPVAGLIDGVLYETVIDRTFIDEVGVRWIIDYKSSDHDGDPEAFLDGEKSLYQEQLERYARLLAQREERTIRLGLYFPLLAGWREWGSATVLRKQATLFEL